MLITWKPLRAAFARLGTGTPIPVRRGELEGSRSRGQHVRCPCAQVHDDDARLMLVVALPGADPARMQLLADEARLFVHAPLYGPAQDALAAWTWQRTFVLPHYADAERGRARFHADVLTVLVPKRPWVGQHLALVADC